MCNRVACSHRLLLPVLHGLRLLSRTFSNNRLPLLAALCLHQPSTHADPAVKLSCKPASAGSSPHGLTPALQLRVAAMPSAFTSSSPVSQRSGRQSSKQSKENVKQGCTLAIQCPRLDLHQQPCCEASWQRSSLHQSEACYTLPTYDVVECELLGMTVTACLSLRAGHKACLLSG